MHSSGKTAPHSPCSPFLDSHQDAAELPDCDTPAGEAVSECGASQSQQESSSGAALRDLIQSRLVQPAAEAKAAAAAAAGAAAAPAASSSRPASSSKPGTGNPSPPQTAQPTGVVRPRSGPGTAAAAAAAQVVTQSGPSAVEVYVLALKRALAQPQYAAGFVVDGLASHLVPPLDAARALLSAAGLELKQPATAPTLPLGKGKPPANATAAAARKTSAAGKGTGVPDVPAEPAKPDEWLGAQHVHVIQLQLSEPEAAARREAGFGETERDQQAGQLLHENEEPSSPLAKRWQAYEANTAALAPVLGSLQAGDSPVRHRLVAAGSGESAVHTAAVGVSFDMGKVLTVLPPVAADALLLPPPYVLRVLQRPKERRGKGAPAHFTLWTAPPEAAAATSAGATGWALVPAAAAEAAPMDDKAAGRQSASGQAAAKDGPPTASAASSAAGAASSAGPRKSLAGASPRKGRREGSEESMSAAHEAAVAAEEQ